MPGRIFPVPVPNVRKGGSVSDPADVGPTFDGDQKYDIEHNGQLVQSHRGVAHLKNEHGSGGKQLHDKFVWMEE